MLNVHLTQSRYTPCKKSDPVSLPIERSMLCTQMYMCIYLRMREREREKRKEKQRETGNSILLYIHVLQKCNRSVCPVPRALSPWYSTTYEHANYPKEFAGVRSFRVSKDFPLSVISFHEFSSRISARQKLHHGVNAIIKRKEHYHGLCN